MSGVDWRDLLRSGDEVAGRQDAGKVRQLIREKVVIDDAVGNRQVAVVGEDEWPLLIPLAQEGEFWRLDVEAGREERLNSRIAGGGNVRRPSRGSPPTIRTRPVSPRPTDRSSDGLAPWSQRRSRRAPWWAAPPASASGRSSGGETANIRRVSAACCDKANQSAVQAVAPEARKDAEECLAAKQQLVDATTAGQADLAARKIKLLCDDRPAVRAASVHEVG